MRPKQNVSKVPQIFRRVSVRGAVLVWRRCDTPCTSGFTDDVMFAHEAADKAVCLRTVSFFCWFFRVINVLVLIFPLHLLFVYLLAYLLVTGEISIDHYYHS